MTSKDLNTLTLAEAKEEIERLRSIILPNLRNINDY